jgi:DNA-directed RNA polymerase subunit RPC12/RpoP
MNKVKYDGSRCPFCNSRNILAIELIEMKDDTGHREVECHDCGGLWKEIVKIVGYEPVEAPMPLGGLYA